VETLSLKTTKEEDVDVTYRQGQVGDSGTPRAHSGRGAHRLLREQALASGLRSNWPTCPNCGTRFSCGSRRRLGSAERSFEASFRAANDGQALTIASSALTHRGSRGT
jgi:hypothetical protein